MGQYSIAKVWIACDRFQESFAPLDSLLRKIYMILTETMFFAIAEYIDKDSIVEVTFKYVSKFLLNKSHINEYIVNVQVMAFNNLYRVTKLY